MSGGEVKTVLVLVAMKEEALPFIEVHGLLKVQDWTSKKLPFRAFRGTVNGMDTVLVWAGLDERYNVNNVATTAATLSAFTSLQAFQPDLVISAGTAGGFSEAGAAIADVFLSTKCVYHSRRIPSSVNSREMEEYGFGHFRSPALAGMSKACGLKQGVVSTSDSLDFTPKDLQLMRQEGAVVKEMEAAAIAWVCRTLDVPFISLNAITDLIDGDNNS
jgi:nucleoside phosphorylase